MPVKEKKEYVCKECGFKASTMYGRCPHCNAWDSMVLETRGSKKTTKQDIIIRNLDEIELSGYDIISTESGHINRLFGEGIVKGEIVLISGAPGVGKSTFAFFLAATLPDARILYISGEESPVQLKIRADRLSVGSNIDIITTNYAEDFTEYIDSRYDLIIIDSIQTINSRDNTGVSGSPTMVKLVLAMIASKAKVNGVPVLIIGHITKDGSIAGPKTLEHMVDSVFIIDKLRNNMRVVRSLKNRFGSTDEIILLNMKSSGFELIENMDMVNTGSSSGIGKCISCTMKGSMPVAVEIQGLAALSKYGTPQRVSGGIPFKRIQMLLGVMDKYMDINLGNRDVFVNVSNGIKIDDPLCDLAVVFSLYSSYRNYSIGERTGFIGEVNLSGEIISTPDSVPRIRHLIKMGITKIFIPGGLEITSDNINMIEIKKLGDIKNYV